jgi:hypothetical protein
VVFFIFRLCKKVFTNFLFCVCQKRPKKFASLHIEQKIVHLKNITSFVAFARLFLENTKSGDRILSFFFVKNKTQLQLR